MQEELRSVTADDKAAWDKHAGHPLQSWSWGEFRSAMGLTVERFALFEKNTLVQPWQMTVHPVPVLPMTIGYVAKSPIPDSRILRHLTLLGKKHRSVSVLIEPNAVKGSPVPPFPTLRPATHPLFTKYTFVLDLTKTEDELLAAMHPKTRYNIRLASRHGVTITEDDSPKAFDAYLRLSEETTVRQGFYAHDEKYHRTMWNIMHKNGIATLWTATYKEEILAAWIIFRWNDTLYYPYGASSRLHREVMAPNLLLWEIALWGKRNGYKAFDLWGSMGPNPDPNDPWYGFHRFKEGYRPQLVEFLGSYDLVVNPPAYRAYMAADKLRSLALRIRARTHKA